MQSPGAEPADISDTPADETVDRRGLVAEERPAPDDVYSTCTSLLSMCFICGVLDTMPLPIPIEQF